MHTHMHMHACMHMHVEHDKHAKHGCFHVSGHLQFLYMCHGTFQNSRTPADLNALGPGYEFRPDLVTIP